MIQQIKPFSFSSCEKEAAPGLCPRLLLPGRVSGLERAAGMHLGPGQQPSCPSKPSAPQALFPPVPCWGTNTANECYRDIKRTGSLGAGVITPHGCWWCWRARFDDPGPLLFSYKRGMAFRYGKGSRAKPSPPWMLNAVTDWEAHLAWLNPWFQNT